MKSGQPPPVIDSERALADAIVDDIPYQQYGLLLVGGMLVWRDP